MTVHAFPGRTRIDALELKIATSDGHPGKVTNVEYTWNEMVARLSQSRGDKLTHSQYRDLSSAEQLKRKRKGGYFVGAQFEGGIRKKQNAGERYILSYDIDAPTEDLIGALRRGATDLGDVEYVMYSTYSHTKAKPKIRVIVPLSEPISNELFAAVSRIAGSRIDPGLVCIDNVSFREAQFMYWPAHTADVKPLFVHNQGALLDPDVLLNSFPNWQDYAHLPKSPREADLREAGSKAADPTTKRGIVGAFCREFDIHQAIDRFLEGVYEPFQVEGGVVQRYTYTGGTGVGGAIVYDDGLHLYSQHGSDPCSAVNVNAFDMVRLHLFGEQDVSKDADLPPNAYPSYTKMLELAGEIPEVTSNLLRANYPFDDDTIDDSFALPADAIDAVPPEADLADDISLDTKPNYVTPNDDWLDALDVNVEKGTIKSTLPNIILILSHAPRFAGVFGFNDFTQDKVQLKPFSSKTLSLYVPGPTRTNPVVLISETAMVAVRHILESPRGEGKPGWGLRVSDRDLDAAITKVCNDNRVHPIRDYLRSIKWDGKPRLDKLWIKACHTEDNEYFRETARMWMTAAVARVEQPGCKFDYAIMIEGPQGLRKSSLLNVLGSFRYTTQIEGHFEDTAKYVEATKGFWIIELPELVQFGKADHNAIKMMVTKQVDTVRLAYGKQRGVYPRQSVMAGTTNDKEYLRDPTGNRRYWPIPCGPGQIDTDWVAANRDQLWAEAVQNYLAIKKRNHNNADMPLPLMLSPEVEAQAGLIQRSRVVSDGSEEFAGVVERWLETPVHPALANCGADPSDGSEVTSDFDPDMDDTIKRDQTCAMEIWELALNRKSEQYGQSQAQYVVRRAMSHLTNWRTTKNSRSCGRYGKQRVYVRVGSSADF